MPSFTTTELQDAIVPWICMRCFITSHGTYTKEPRVSPENREKNKVLFEPFVWHSNGSRCHAHKTFKFSKNRNYSRAGTELW